MNHPTAPCENPPQRDPAVADAFAAVAAAGGEVCIARYPLDVLTVCAIGDGWSTPPRRLDPTVPGPAFRHVVEDLRVID